MTTEEISKALVALGFDHGWSVSNGEIVFWELDAAQPSNQELQHGLKLAQQQDQQKALAAQSARAKLTALGLTDAEIAALVG